MCYGEYGSMLRRERRSADFQSAVSPICNRQDTGLLLPRPVSAGSAECNSAIRPIENLRYEFSPVRRL